MSPRSTFVISATASFKAFLKCPTMFSSPTQFGSLTCTSTELSTVLQSWTSQRRTETYLTVGVKLLPPRRFQEGFLDR
eukprot:UN10460